MVINNHYELANLFIRTMEFEEIGDSESYDGHAHRYDHAHFLAAGAVDVEVNGQVTPYAAPAMIWVKAETTHKLTATAPKTVGLCIHALRSADMSGEPLDPALIPKGVSALAVAACLSTRDCDRP